MNQYLILRNGKYTVLNTRETLIMFYKYFLDKPGFLGHSRPGKICARVFYHCIENILKALYFPFLGLIFFKTVYEENDFLIKRRGQGQWASTVWLIKNNDGKHKIRKFYASKHKVDNEVLFIETYKNRTNNIVLPSYKRLGPNIIEFDFIKGMNLVVELKLGYIKKSNLEAVYQFITEALEKMYGEGPCLIHGDMFPINLYLKKPLLYLIDFGEAHIYKPGYDKFQLLIFMLEECYGYVDWDIVKKYFDNKEISQYKKHHSRLMMAKH